MTVSLAMKAWDSPSDAATCSYIDCFRHYSHVVSVDSLLAAVNLATTHESCAAERHIKRLRHWTRSARFKVRTGGYWGLFSVEAPRSCDV